MSTPTYNPSATPVSNLIALNTALGLTKVGRNFEEASAINARATNALIPEGGAAAADLSNAEAQAELAKYSGSHLAGLRNARSILRQMDATGTGQLAIRFDGDSLGDRAGVWLLAWLVERYGVAGWLGAMHNTNTLTAYTPNAGGATVYPGANDFTVSPTGLGYQLDAVGENCRSACLNTSNAYASYSPSILDPAAGVYAANKVWVVAKAHGPNTGGTFKVAVSVDDITYVDVAAHAAVVVTSSTSAQIFELSITPQKVRGVRITNVSGAFVVTHAGAYSTTATGIVAWANNLGAATLANMSGATDAAALKTWFGAEVVTNCARNDSLATMEAAWNTYEAQLASTEETIYYAVPQSSVDNANDPTNSRNIMIARRAAARGGVFIDTVAYQCGPYIGGYAYTNSSAAGTQFDTTHPNNLLWAQVACEPAYALGFSMATLLTRFPVLRTTNIVGNLILAVAGNGVQIREGTNARMGVATLVNGTVTIANTSVTTSTRFILTRRGKNASTAIGNLSVETVTASTSFVVTSLTLLAATETGDQSSFHWQLVEAAAAPLN